MAKLMGVTEYARHKGRNLKTIQEAIERESISYTMVGKKKMIDPKVADAEWAENVDPTQDRRYNANPVLEDDRSASRIKNSVPSFADSRAIREAFNARITKIEYEEKAGLVVKKQEVEQEAYQAARRVRDALLNIPTKIAPEIASITDSFLCEQFLDKHIREALEDLCVDPA